MLGSYPVSFGGTIAAMQVESDARTPFCTCRMFSFLIDFLRIHIVLVIVHQIVMLACVLACVYAFMC